MDKIKRFLTRQSSLLVISLLLGTILFPLGTMMDVSGDTSTIQEPETEIINNRVGKGIWDSETTCTPWSNWSPWGPWTLVRQLDLTGSGFECEYVRTRTRTRHCRTVSWFFGHQWSNNDWWETQTQTDRRICFSVTPCPPTPPCDY